MVRLLSVSRKSLSKADFSFRWVPGSHFKSPIEMWGIFLCPQKAEGNKMCLRCQVKNPEIFVILTTKLGKCGVKHTQILFQMSVVHCIIGTYQTKGYKMPNWVFNGLTIEGNPEQVNKLIRQMNKPFKNPVQTHGVGDLGFNVKEVLYPNPIFAFHNIYSYVDAGITDEEYIQQPPRTEDFKDWLKFETKDWYNFNNREWGTKWDVAVAHDEEYPDTYMEEADNGENKVVYYNFNTAWSVPAPAISKLSAQYPTLLFTLSYEEETGWGGEMEFLRGEVISNSEYGWQCRECDHTEDETPYCETCEFDMCPSCGYGEPMDEDRAKCQTHGVKLETKEKAEV